MDKVEENLELIKSYGIKCGLSIKPGTPVKSLVPYLPLLDLILVMSVEPGRGGQLFIDGTEKKIREVRELISVYHSKALINVDGGIDDITKNSCQECDILTSGSYIIQSDNFQERIDSLR